MRRILRVSLFLCVTIFWGSCIRDVQGIEEEEYNPASPVRFITTDAANAHSGDAKGDDKGSATRGTPITDASQITSLGVFASSTGTTDWTSAATLGKMFNQRLNKEGDEWEYVGKEFYWDCSLGERHSFFAYAPYATDNYNDTTNASGNGIVVNGESGDAGVPTLTYTVPTKVQNQPDLMVATPRKNLRPTGAPVSLAMNHALTSVGFLIKGSGEKVTGIKVQGVATTGTLDIDGETLSWDVETPTDTDFSASLKYDEGQNFYTTTSATTNPIADDGYLMMIPQTLGEGAKVIITYLDGSTKEYSLEGKTWEAGQKVMYNITLKKDGPAPPLTGIVDKDGGHIVSVDSNGELNVEGRGFAVYFKWGSLIARSSAKGNDDPFDVSDVVWVPDGYDYPALKASIEATSGGKAAWALIKPQVGAITENVLEGWGDPCRQIDGGGWRMMSAADTYAFTGFQGEKKTTTDYYDYDNRSGTMANPGVGWFPLGNAPTVKLPVGGKTNSDGEIKELADTSRFWTSDMYNSSVPRYLWFKSTTSSTDGNDQINDGGMVRCVESFISITPSNYTFPDEGGTAYFAVTTKNATGIPSIINNNSWLTATLEGNRLKVTATGNATYDTRSATITLSVTTSNGTDTAVLTLMQGTMLKGVFAPPGVIGYIAGTNTLTLRGSKEYAANADIAAFAEMVIDPRGLSDKTVYVAYFKFGSLVAVSSDPTDSRSPFLESDDIIAGPAEWSGYSALKANPTWEGVPSYEYGDRLANVSSGSYHKTDNIKKGKGDPCMYYADYFGSGWKLPTGNPYYHRDGIADYSTSNMPMYQAGELGPGLPAGRLSTRPGETGMFYPAAGYRVISYQGYVDDQNRVGAYWSSTPWGDLESWGRMLWLASDGLSLIVEGYGANPYYDGYPIRCIGGASLPAPTIDIDRLSHKFLAPGGDATFNVTTTNFTGTPSISEDADWLEASIVGGTLTVSAQRNNGPARSATVTLTVNSDIANYGYDFVTLTITQDPVVGGVLAPPGVIGYIAGTDILTLKGSREYSVNSDIANFATTYFGGLSDKTVYAAMFQFGSLVATSSDPYDTAVPYLETVDIIAGPEQWMDFSLLKANPSWTGIPVYTSEDYNKQPSTAKVVSDPSYHNAENIALGKGDPCMYYFGDQHGGGWRLPVGGPSTSYNDNGDYTIGYFPWKAAGVLGEGLPAGRLSTSGVDKPGMFYPAVGSRDYSNGSLSGQNTSGSYWSSGAANNGYYLSFGSSDPVYAITAAPSYTSGFPIRCIQLTPTVSLSSSTASYISDGATKEFTYTTTNFVGTVVASTIDSATGQSASSWVTVTVNGDGTFEVKVEANGNAVAGRTATVTLKATNPTGTGTATMTITQDRLVAEGVLAPPGVIGYIKGTNTLTLKGSKEYAANAAIEAYAEAKFGGLSTETVYAAMFKFGSLVAISSNSDNTPIKSEDIIAGPPEWNGYPALKASPSWGVIPFQEGLGSYTGDYPENIRVDLSSGYGDPCDYWFGDSGVYSDVNGGGRGDGNSFVSTGNTWRLPTANPYNGSPNYDESNLVWHEANALGAGLPQGRLSTRSGETGMFYPAVGYLSDDYGNTNSQYYSGWYWSSLITSVDFGSALAFVYPDETSMAWTTKVHPTKYGQVLSYGLTVRCVPVSPTISGPPSTYRFPAAAATTTFPVTTGFFSGTPTYTVSSGADWIHPEIVFNSVNSYTLSVTVDENTLTRDAQRSGVVTLTVTNTGGTATTTMTITQDPMVGGTLAPPGVIGFIRGTNTLTLRGSKEYAYSSLDSDGVGDNDFEELAKTIHPDGLETETVYVALFKFGSLVAVSGDPTDNVSPNLEPWDVIAAPSTTDGYKGLEALKAEVASKANSTDVDRWYNTIPPGDTFGAGLPNDKINEGRGDACVYYFGNNTGNGYKSNTWKLPTGNPYNGYTGSVDNKSSILKWKTAGEIGDGLPAGVLSINETGIFYPVAGYRKAETFGNGYMGSDNYTGLFDGSKGGYWSNQWYGVMDDWMAWAFDYYGNEDFNANIRAIASRGYGIRCVR